MYLLKLDATDSTNSYLRELARTGQCKNWTVISAEHQTEGRGQQGAVWESQRSKNLMSSILIQPDHLKATDQMNLNWAVSLGIFRALQVYKLNNLKIKWPNDIMSGSKKLGGILIENILVGNSISQCIAGFGINVNQLRFAPNLPQAISMTQITGKEFDRMDLLHRIVRSIKLEFDRIHSGEFENLKLDYEENLFRKDLPFMYREPESESFPGIIRGVDQQGKLLLEKEDNKLYSYDFKEVIYL